MAITDKKKLEIFISMKNDQMRAVKQIILGMSVYVFFTVNYKIVHFAQYFTQK